MPRKPSFQVDLQAVGSSRRSSQRAWNRAGQGLPQPMRRSFVRPQSSPCRLGHPEKSVSPFHEFRIFTLLPLVRGKRFKSMSVAIVWFRKSLRLDDNPALMQACSSPSIRSVIPFYAFDPELFGESLEKLGPPEFASSGKPSGFGLSLKVTARTRLGARKARTRLLALARMQGAELSLLSSDYCSEPYGRSSPNESVRVFRRISPMSKSGLPRPHTPCWTSRKPSPKQISKTPKT